MALLAGGSALSNILGGIIGGSKASAAAEQAMALLDESKRRMEALNLPEEIQNKILYEQYQTIGNFTPEQLERASETYFGPEILRQDPKNRLQQMAAISQLEQISKTGLGPQERMQLEQARVSAERDAKARLASLKSEAMRTGQYGSGSDLGLRAIASQGAAQDQAMQNLQIASQAAPNRMNALTALINQTNAMSQQDLDIAEKNALAREQNKQLQAKYSQDVKRDMWAAAEGARQAKNLAMQTASDKNIGTTQAEALRQMQAKKDLFDMAFRKQNALSNLDLGKAQALTGRGAAQAAGWQAIGSGIGSGLTAYGGFSAMGDQTKAINNLADSQKQMAFMSGNPTTLPAYFNPLSRNTG